MNYWVFTVTNQKAGKKSISAREIYLQRMQDKFWGLGEKTPNRNNIQTGDKIIFYIGIPERAFGGIATATTPSFSLAQNEIQKYAHNLPHFTTEYGIKLADIEIWDTPKIVPELVSQLSFIENKEYWGSYFQGGVRGITVTDYNKIVSTKLEDRPLQKCADEAEFSSTQQFALEAHLEEFMHTNWEKIAWGRSLRLYETPEGNGRQFPAGTWSIDFLAVDNDTNDLVIIELKRGQSSDATIGQVLRYMGWVRQNIANGQQNVHGIIVCHEVDEALKYAVQQINDVDVFTYEVNFELRAMLK